MQHCLPGCEGVKQHFSPMGADLLCFLLVAENESVQTLQHTELGS